MYTCPIGKNWNLADLGWPSELVVLHSPIEKKRCSWSRQHPSESCNQRHNGAIERKRKKTDLVYGGHNMHDEVG